MDYVFSCADGLTWEQLAPFVRSAKICAPGARLVLFCVRVDESTRALLRDSGVELQPFDALFPEADRWRTRLLRHALWKIAVGLCRALRYREFCRRALLRAGGLLLPRNQARFFHYLAFLEDTAQPGDRILLCDARDVIFQADPFAHLPSRSAFLTEEEASVPLHANAFNAQWYRETYGAAALARDGTHAVVCAGVFGGERDSLLAILNAFVAESATHPHRYGADQAIINHLHFEGRLATRALPNRGALVWHLFGVNEAEIVITPDHGITDRQGYCYPLIHMYDRTAAADLAVRARWS